MFEKVLLLTAILSVALSNPLNPFDLIEEAEHELLQLQNLVSGEIFVARDRLQSAYTDFGMSSTITAGEGVAAIHAEEETILSELSTIKALAASAGKDITSCTDSREEVLTRLWFKHGEEIGYCIGGISWSAMLVVEDARYFVDIIMNKVHEIEFQLRQCREDLLCISPLITQIELYKVQLPQEIEKEVQACGGLLESLEVSTKACAEDNVAAYILEANTLLGEITSCVNDIID